jgi:sugar O-acyltransferase (sialic acid O-acetyltransferase NeuD family)
MKNIVIIGAGGLAKEIKYLIDAINRQKQEWHLLGFIDNWGKQKGDGIVDGYQVIGNTEDFNKINEDIYGVIGVGFPGWIKEIIGLLNNPKAKYPNLIHPSVEINTQTIGTGNIICFGSGISCNVEIDSFNLINVKCYVGHDVKIGSYNVFNPNTQIAGSVIIGNQNLWGMNSSIFQGLKVGSNNVIGASSFVKKNVKNGETLVGVPAKNIKNNA